MKRVRRTLSTEDQTQLRTRLDSRIPESTDSIGQLVRDMRLAAQMSQEEYADTTGVALRALTQIENSQGNPGLDTLEKLLRPFGYRVGIVRDGPAGAEDLEPRPSTNSRSSNQTRAIAFAARSGFWWNEVPADGIAVYACFLIPEHAVGYFRGLVTPIYDTYLKSKSDIAEWDVNPSVLPELQRRAFDVLHDLEPRIIYAALRIGKTRLPQIADRTRRSQRSPPDLVIDPQQPSGFAFERLLRKLRRFSRETHVDTTVTLYSDDMSVYTQEQPEVGERLKSILRGAQVSDELSVSLSAEFRGGYRAKSSVADPPDKELRVYRRARLHLLAEQSELLLLAYLIAQSLRLSLTSSTEGTSLNGSDATENWELRSLLWHRDPPDTSDRL